MNNTCLDSWFWFGDNQQLDCVVYCRLGLHRSLAGEVFPHRSTKEDMIATQNKVLPVLASLSAENQFLITSESEGDCLPSAREVFDISSLTTLQAGQAVFLGPKGLLVLINMNSHVVLSQIGPGTRALESFSELLTMDAALDTSLSWACSETYGFLNPEPIHTGSGLECNALLFLPGIMDSAMFERVMKGLLSQGFELSVYNAESAEKSPYPLVELHYAVPPGMPEQEGLERIGSALEGLIRGERATREKLVQNRYDEIRDSSSRAFGILSNAYLLEKDECRQLLSDLRKGLVYSCLPVQEKAGFIKDIDRWWFAGETLVRQNLEGVPKQQITDNYIKSLRAKLVRSVLSQYHIDRGI